MQRQSNQAGIENHKLVTYLRKRYPRQSNQAGIENVANQADAVALTCANRTKLGLKMRVEMSCWGM